jgi:hypothetical protein
MENFSSVALWAGTGSIAHNSDEHASVTMMPHTIKSARAYNEQLSPTLDCISTHVLVIFATVTDLLNSATLSKAEAA